MLREQSQEGRLGDTLFASKSRTHFAGLVSSDQPIELVSCEAIREPVSLDLADWLWRARLGLTRVHPFHGSSDGRHLIYLEAGPVRVTS
ncbi:MULTISPECIES: hypothetical protein [Paenarthrobacter]|uniref:Uncharacterized protein n=1 Tax=Paenarthrobacter ureafaciens TaxID=37931 RepID=A0AAX3EGN7_PAEUR|nr:MULTISPECIES: hypothetical protein [Paenarthrobacter]MDO5866111.1 hypothetical protein [Paenarthrobacter sp. SD-2]QMU83751.1 hypothetical protein FV140_17915 [Paenarthrobacter ureafaciens]UYV92409.1 hypothetical protein NL395_18105 [Paenarthrobacter ureafaciens]UYV96944.1 hypothetical protein NL394_18135 [Paenarthrobacter ureafaciens]WIV32308.1 hypothetical protein QN084_06775 [Paenarthrobacter sp. R1]